MAKNLLIVYHSQSGTTARLALAADGSFELSAALLPGENVIVVTAEDRAGNNTEKSLKVYRKPKLELDAPPTQIRGSRGVVELHGRFSSAGAIASRAASAET